MQALFIHGMGRSPLSGWPLLRRLRAEGISTTAFAYVAATQSFAQISARLAVRIAAMGARDNYVLIGHSLGGVLLRAALAAQPPGTRQPSRVFLLGSPVHPSRLAVHYQRNLLYRLLTGDCGQLLASNERMSAIAPLSVPTTAILGERPIRLTARHFVGETNDGIVALTEAQADWINEVIRVPVMHSFLSGNRRVAELVLARIEGCLAAPGDDLANRRPVWEALSELFLDTDVTLSREWRARQLAASPYPIEHLERILTDEIMPICQSNLYAVAGVWSGFDLQWLEESILRRSQSRWRSLLALFSLIRRSRVPEEWHSTKAMIKALRRA